MTRFQRRAASGSRPEGLGHPRGTRHTAASYAAKYKDCGRHNFTRRLARMIARERRA